MSEYFRVPDDINGPADKSEWLEGYFEPVQVDEWHPASEPPKPEDFEPTGWIQLLVENKYPIQATEIDLEKSFRNRTHWRKITPPKT